MSKRREAKRVSLLELAASVFSLKSYAESTISDIAKAASIADSGFYNYFRTKEDVLFAIPEYHMKRYLSALEEQLEGIEEAGGKLRKLIWYHARYFTVHEKYTRILLLECRSNPRFYYESEAYKLIKKYSKLITSLVESGVREGNISLSCPSRLLRDMIMGALDQAALNWILNKGPSPLDKAEGISELVFNSLRPSLESRNFLDPKTDKAKRILNAGVQAFAEKGYADTTVNEIARRAQVAEGTIYGYYQSKEDILIKIPTEKLQELFSYIAEVDPEKKLERMLLSCFRFFNNNSDFTSVLVLMLRPNKSFYTSESYQILERVSGEIANTVREGVKQGLFKKNVDVDSFLHLVFGTIDHIIIPWVMFKRKYALLPVGEEASRLFIDAIRA